MWTPRTTGDWGLEMGGRKVQLRVKKKRRIIMIVHGLKGWELLTPSARRANSVRRDARATQCVKEAHSARIQDQPETGLIFNKLEEETSFGWSGSGRPFGSTEIVHGRTGRFFGHGRLHEGMGPPGAHVAKIWPAPRGRKPGIPRRRGAVFHRGR